MYQELFFELYISYFRKYKLSLHAKDDMRRTKITVSANGEDIVRITAESDTVLLLKNEDDLKEAEERKELAYFKAYNSLKSWIKRQSK